MVRRCLGGNLKYGVCRWCFWTVFFISLISNFSFSLINIYMYCRHRTTPPNRRIKIMNIAAILSDFIFIHSTNDFISKPDFILSHKTLFPFHFNGKRQYIVCLLYNNIYISLSLNYLLVYINYIL